MAGDFAGRVKFVAVDVDKSKDVAEDFNVGPMPTLVLMKDGEEFARVLGADENKIRSMIEDAL